MERQTLSKWSLVVAMLLPVVLTACQLIGSSDSIDEGITISTGQTFGFCIGYCERVLTLSESESTLTTRTSQPGAPDPEYPTVQQDWPLRASQWDSLVALVDEDVFRSRDAVYGCPDCADGGAEYIEITFAPGDTSRVTFEFGATVDGIDDLITYARALRRSAIIELGE